jgi:hypothetical protein
LDANLLANCLPASAVNMSTADFPDFLRQRRKLMAEKIRAYYFGL